MKSLFGLCLLALLVGFKPPPRQLTVAAASDLQFALTELVKEFEAKHPGLTVTVTYGSSGNFYTQLENKAPFDVFLSADAEYPRQLAAKGLAVKDSVFLYAIGHLVVWVPNVSKLDVAKLGIKTLTDPSIKKVAIANPRHAPYGRAAEAALKSLGVAAAVQPKLVLGENVAQAAQFVVAGAADAGIIALSLARAPALAGNGRSWDVPADAHPRLEQGGAIMSWAKEREAAESFRAFLTGPAAKPVLERFGFQAPGA